MGHDDHVDNADDKDDEDKGDIMGSRLGGCMLILI